jgi:hypothetical protein
LRTEFRATPKLVEISFFDRPAYQCTKISQISITSSPPRHRITRLKDEGKDLELPNDQEHPDTTP